MPAFVDLGTAVCSDTWAGIASISIQVNSATPVNSLSYVNMAFRRDRLQETPDLLLTSPNSGITITNASSWTFQVNSRVFTNSADIYFWDLTTIDASSSAQTYLNGQIILLNGVDEDE